MNNLTYPKTGRIQAAEPNPQNIPIRTPEGKRIRDLFVKRRPSWWALAWLSAWARGGSVTCSCSYLPDMLCSACAEHQLERGSGR